MKISLYALILGLCGHLSLYKIHAQSEVCANEASDLIEDESISRYSSQAGTTVDPQEALAQLNAIIARAENARDALDAAIATGKALKQRWKVTEVSSLPFSAVASQGPPSDQSDQLDLIGEQLRPV